MPDWPAILCIFILRAWMRPLASRCLAMMQRMWSAKMKEAWRMGMGLAWGLDVGLWMVMFRALLSSSTPDTCMSWNGGTTKAHLFHRSSLKHTSVHTFYSFVWRQNIDLIFTWFFSYKPFNDKSNILYPSLRELDGPFLCKNPVRIIFMDLKPQKSTTGNVL